MNAKKKKLIYNSVTFGIVILAFILCNVFYGDMSRSLRGQLIPICCWIVMAVSLNLVVGISGELSLGHAGFMSLGAFSGIVVSGWMLNGFQMENETLRLVIAIVTGGVVAGVLGALIGIPVLRLRRLSGHRDPGLRGNHPERAELRLCLGGRAEAGAGLH